MIRPLALTCSCGCNKAYCLEYPFHKRLYAKHIRQHTTDNVAWVMLPLRDYYGCIWRYLSRRVMSAPIFQAQIKPVAYYN